MTQPRVWAPNAAVVELACDGVRHRMQRNGEWWEATFVLKPGDRYAFFVDGTGPLPDPRARAQPDGVHGTSMVVPDGPPPAAFRAPPLTESVFYELHVGTFSDEGTFAGVVGHLDDLVELGITTVELMPVVEFPGNRGWGYDGADLFASHRGYGRPEDLRALVEACHDRGLAVVLDVVYNHLGPDGNYLGSFGPYFTERYRTPWGAAVNLDDAGSDEVRGFIVDNALMWLFDYGFDGLRLDAVHALADSSAVHLLEELTTTVKAKDATKLLIAESDLNDPRVLRPVRDGGYGLDAQWSDDFHHALHAVLTGERTGYYGDYGSVDTLADALDHGFVYRGQRSPSRGRRHGRPLGDISRARLLGYAQNHDQVGNRARGERLCHLVGEDALRVAAALVLLGPFTPMLFMGEEWAASSPFQYFTDHRDGGLARAVREGRRSEFQSFGWEPDDVPDPQAESTFYNSVLRWHERAVGVHARMLAFHRDLVGLRREQLVGADTEVRREGASRLEMHRGDVNVHVDFAAPSFDIS